MSWVTRLRKCLDSMPPTVEIVMRSQGTVEIAARGTDVHYFSEHGHVDNPEYLHVFQVRRGPNSRIFGRDSHN